MQGVARSWSLIIRALIRTTDCRSWGTREGTREGQGEKKLKDWVDWGAGDELLDCNFERLVSCVTSNVQNHLEYRCNPYVAVLKTGSGEAVVKSCSVGEL
ncbi:hypothetical protein Pmani_020582 [Petrolisthes manimaculis]|uniref:Uncharacterized protein n=1 Tax=Petrolisthes manimaculis TaxID=1843537 RepID=A0AAE1PIE0_9EUCA|nr:hypothetical protein Pmani_020582 [Petrolisthes manimaculis]